MRRRVYSSPIFSAAINALWGFDIPILAHFGFPFSVFQGAFSTADVPAVTFGRDVFAEGGDGFRAIIFPPMAAGCNFEHLARDQTSRSHRARPRYSAWDR